MAIFLIFKKAFFFFVKPRSINIKKIRNNFSKAIFEEIFTCFYMFIDLMMCLQRKTINIIKIIFYLPIISVLSL